MSESNHDAAGPAAGYLFQPEKALLRLAKAPIGASVGVETGDDVVEKFDGEVTHSEQLKNTQIGQGNPFADRSVGLWKTLFIWTQKNAAKEENRALSRLILSTNRSLPNKCLARSLADAKDLGGIEEVILSLKDTGVNASDSIKTYVETVLQTNHEGLVDIVSRIRLDEGYENVDGIRGQTIGYLQLPSNVDSVTVYNSLLGWLSHTLKGLWDAGEAGWIESEAFANQKQAVIEEYRRQSFSARAARAISVTPAEQDSKRKDLFVQQLQVICADEDEIVDAIIEMVRESKETTRLYREGVITYQEFEERDERLHTRWKQIFRRNLRSGGPLPEEEVGYRIFDDATDHNESVGTIKPIDRYMTAGALHRLANDVDNQFRIGWHPKFKQLFLPTDSE